MGFPSPRPRPRSAGHRPLNIRPRSPSWISPRQPPPRGTRRHRAAYADVLRPAPNGRGASLVAVPSGAPVSVARPRPRPKGTTAPGKPAPCVSRASPDPGRRPSTRRTVRPRRGPGAGGTHRQPSPARPAVAGYGISPRSRCGLPEPRHCIGKRGRPVHNPEPDIAGFAPQRSAHGGRRRHSVQDRSRCYTADRVDSFVGHVPLFPRDSATRGGFPLSPSGTGEPAPRIVSTDGSASSRSVNASSTFRVARAHASPARSASG